jgi:DNA (cytosine-5)-methyltransferase 1
MRTLWQVEIDEYCRRVLSKHWPNVKRYSDVRDCCGWNHRANCPFPKHLRRVDVISGGFPCQDISSSSPTKSGLDGERSGLWSEMRRIFSAIRPGYIVVENASALLERGMGRVLGELAESGYDATWNCIPASAFGAPHERDRTFIVAYPIGERQPFSWGCFDAIGKEADAYREADSLIDAVRGSSLPYVCGRHDGIPRTVERLHSIGNAIVPQITEFIGRRIVEASNQVS